MCKKMVFLVSFALVLSLTSNASSGLVAHWRLDEGSDTTVYDSSGNNYHGTLNGNPSWVAGKIGGALELDGNGDYVDFGNPADLPSGKAERSICGWGKTDIVSSGYRWIAAYGTPTTSQAFFIGLNGTTIVGGGYGGDDVLHSDFWEVDVWHHICLTYDGAIARLYADGVEVASTTKNWNLILSRAFIGEQVNNASELWDGVVDDVRIYDHVLSENEVMAAMVGEGYPYAYGPTPEDGALHEDTWISLSWRAGDFTVSHDVYLGDNFEDVNAGAESTFQGNQDITNLVAGFPGFAYPDGLVPGTTYYWRIDEVNDTEPNSPWKGEVWSFSIPPNTAYFPDPADAAEQVDPDANLSWTPGFGAKLHTVYFGDNFDEVDSVTGGLPQGVATYDPGTLKLARTYYWRVDEFDAIETHKGDVWSFTTEGSVGNPNPANGAVDVKQTQIITWSPSVFAASHELYFGTDKDAVKNADTGSPDYKGTRELGAESYDPGMLEWDTTYYWRIDEVNNTNADSPWAGILWSFTTANFLIVDDFESYNDLDPADPESNRIFNAWIDGYDDPANGSLVGYDAPPFAEQIIVHSGNQSMPLFYDNSVGYSEATLTLTYPRDWTEKSVDTLTIWFRGSSANAAETLYVALNGNAIVINDNPDAAQLTTWTQWTVGLQAFADQGVNLANVTTIALGLGNKKNPVAGGSGTMYFDDIRLYRSPPEPAP